MASGTTALNHAWRCRQAKSVLHSPYSSKLHPPSQALGGLGWHHPSSPQHPLLTAWTGLHWSMGLLKSVLNSSKAIIWNGKHRVKMLVQRWVSSPCGKLPIAAVQKQLRGQERGARTRHWPRVTVKAGDGHLGLTVLSCLHCICLKIPYMGNERDLV